MLEAGSGLWPFFFSFSVDRVDDDVDDDDYDDDDDDDDGGGGDNDRLFFCDKANA